MIGPGTNPSNTSSSHWAGVFEERLIRLLVLQMAHIVIWQTSSGSLVRSY